MDTRLAVAAAYTDQAADDFAVTYDGHMSMEFDYLSLGLGNNYRWDFNKKNTSLDVGVYGEYNRVHPVGDIPLPLALMTPAGTLQNRRESADTRTAAEIGIGVTQVIDRASLFQLRFTQSHFAGYLNDPYKLLSVVDDENSASLGATLEYRFENRPGTRDLSTLYFAYKRDFASGVFDMSLRYSVDDWELDASAVDFRFRYRLDGNRYVEPHLRLYHQNEAEFYRYNLVSSEPLPEYASADSRLATFDAITVGLRYGFMTAADAAHSIAVEYYTREGDGSPDEAVGLQRSEDLFPRLETLIVKYLYSTRWQAPRRVS